MKVTSILLSLILFGGVFISSERFMNVENECKGKFICTLLSAAEFG